MLVTYIGSVKFSIILFFRKDDSSLSFVSILSFRNKMAIDQMNDFSELDY